MKNIGGERGPTEMPTGKEREDILTKNRKKESLADQADLYNEAVSYTKQGLIDEAINTYKKILDKDPTAIDSMFELASLYYNKPGATKADAEKSLEYNQMVLEIEKDNALAMFNIATCLEHLGNKEGAEENYRKAIGTGSAPADAYFHLAILLERKKVFTEALGLINQYIEIEGDPDDIYTKAALRMQKRLKKIITVK